MICTLKSATTVVQHFGFHSALSRSLTSAIVNDVLSISNRSWKGFITKE
jgi:hypothetical protein